MTRAARTGFTLFELVLALSLVGGAMLGGALLLDQLNDGTARIVAAGDENTRVANAGRLLQRIIFDAHPSGDTSRKFVGDERSASMLSRCAVPGGWAESCSVTLTIDDRGDSSAVVVDLAIGGSLVLRRDAARRQWRYLDPSPGDTTWAVHWSSATTLPAALALVSGTDTLVFPVQVRRD